MSNSGDKDVCLIMKFKMTSQFLQAEKSKQGWKFKRNKQRKSNHEAFDDLSGDRESVSPDHDDLMVPTNLVKSRSLESLRDAIESSEDLKIVEPDEEPVVSIDQFVSALTNNYYSLYYCIATTNAQSGWLSRDPFKATLDLDKAYLLALGNRVCLELTI